VGALKDLGLFLLIVVALMGAAVAALRYRKLRRDERRVAERRRHATALIPSPYVASGGVHILADGEEPSVPRLEPLRPRIDFDPGQVFSDAAPYEGPAGTGQGRHDDRWALERSFHRTRISPGSVWAFLVAVIVLGTLVVVGAVIQHGGHGHRSSTTTTTTTSTVPHALAAQWPSQLVDYSMSGATASYRVPTTRYDVAVTASGGNEWLVIEMGPARTLEFQGEVVRGTTYRLTLTGAGYVILGSPHNATVSAHGHLVVPPAHEVTPMTFALIPPST
jgi:hypothetical protein